MKIEIKRDKKGIKLGKIIECWWCGDKFNNDISIKTVYSGEFLGGNHDVCKKCNDKYKFIKW